VNAAQPADCSTQRESESGKSGRRSTSLFVEREADAECLVHPVLGRFRVLENLFFVLEPRVFLLTPLLLINHNGKTAKVTCKLLDSMESFA